ncbi:AAA family ATPase [Vibrio casei]|uniref:MoxR family ATPase n=1 Tax=Vibrio casei TaxID=673372 RepID=A0A368LIA0_9VIBR|nr:MoxR family ATPase [Vibrio casei]RCS70093.1 MoxR family ATPase [Vibrio casei]SJN23919.1 MoxR-like ATPase in aerotolerance operon [Vibrio casei]
MNDAQIAMNALLKQIEQAVIGQDHVAKSIVIGLLTRGHILLEGLPGTAKTRSVKALANTLDASFGRVQFTPDLLPSDITGTEMYQEIDGHHQLSFQPGPIFNHILLADEINRAPAKVQAALLEAMAEGTVTIGKSSQKLPEPFIVLATQNPIEQEGTYPLPEAQMDRFMLKVTVDYPEDEAELDIIRLVRGEELQDGKMASEIVGQDKITVQLVLDARQQLADIEVPELVERYIVNLVMATRHPERYSDSNLANWIEVGSSPRASIALDKCARANAWLAGRSHVEPDDVRIIAASVLGHRLNLTYHAAADGIDHQDVIKALLDNVMVG